MQKLTLLITDEMFQALKIRQRLRTLHSKRVNKILDRLRLDEELDREAATMVYTAFACHLKCQAKGETVDTSNPDHHFTLWAQYDKAKAAQQALLAAFELSEGDWDVHTALNSLGNFVARTEAKLRQAEEAHHGQQQQEAHA